MLPLVFRKMQVRATVRYSNTHASMAIIKKQNIPVLERLEREAYQKEKAILRTIVFEVTVGYRKPCFNYRTHPQKKNL